MVAKRVKILFVAEDSELKRAFKSAFESVFNIGLETRSYQRVYEDLVCIVKNNDITHLIIYLHFDGKSSIDEGMKKFCQLRRAFRRVKTPFLGLGFRDKKEADHHFPILKEKGQLYIHLPSKLKEIKQSVIGIEEHDITKEKIKELCPYPPGHSRL